MTTQPSDPHNPTPHHNMLPHQMCKTPHPHPRHTATSFSSCKLPPQATVNLPCPVCVCECSHSLTDSRILMHTHDKTLANNSENEVRKAPLPPLWWIYWLARDTLHTWETQGVFYLPFPKEQTQPPLPVYHPNPGESRLACQLTEEEQIRIAQRIGLIQHLPKGIFDPGSDSSQKKVKE